VLNLKFQFLGKEESDSKEREKACMRTDSIKLNCLPERERERERGCSVKICFQIIL
jgi:hypothetical protein